MVHRSYRARSPPNEMTNHEGRIASSVVAASTKRAKDLTGKGRHTCTGCGTTPITRSEYPPSFLRGGISDCPCAFAHAAPASASYNGSSDSDAQAETGYDHLKQDTCPAQRTKIGLEIQFGRADDDRRGGLKANSSYLPR